MLSTEDIEYFKTNFNVDLSNKTQNEVEDILDQIESSLNQKIVEVQKENLQLEKEIIQLMNNMKTDN